MSNEWWDKAVELEKADRLAEAEAVIRAALAPKGDPWDCQSAYLYELRVIRLLKLGEIAKAREAFKRGCELMRSYASGATSGGEGMALSMEANDYERKLQEMISEAEAKKK